MIEHEFGRYRSCALRLLSRLIGHTRTINDLLCSLLIPWEVSSSSRYDIQLCEAISFTKLRLKALLQACLENSYENIHRRTVGIIFLGTPHQGGLGKDYGSILQQVAKTVRGRSAFALPDAITDTSDSLHRLTRDFRHHSRMYQIVSVCESKPTKPFKSVVSPT